MMNYPAMSEGKPAHYVFTDREAADFLRMSQVKLWRERKAGRISFRRLGGQLAYTRDDLEAYLDRCLHSAVSTEDENVG